MRAPNPNKKYVGIHNDAYGGMSDTGKIIRSAWVFGTIPETETCEGWLPQGLEDLWRKTNAEWEKYDFLVSKLPEEIRTRFERIQSEAIKQAKEKGWNPDEEVDQDNSPYRAEAETAQKPSHSLL